MKNKGCLFTLLLIFGGVAAFFALSALAYSVLVSEGARQFSLFHSRTISLESYYTTVPTGAWFDRVVTIVLFTLLLWFVLWGVLFILQKVTGNTQFTKRPAKGLFIAMLVLLAWSLVATQFVPKRMAVYDIAAKEVKVKDYRALLHIWPMPFASESRVIPFNQVKDVRFAPYESQIMGASHDEMELWLITQSDTVVVGSTMLYHGEFGWLTHRSPKSEVVEAGKKEANRIAEALLGLISENR